MEVEPRDLLCCSINALDEVGADRPPAAADVARISINLWSFAQQQFAKTDVRIGSWPCQNALPQKAWDEAGLRCKLLFRL